MKTFFVASKFSEPTLESGFRYHQNFLCRIKVFWVNFNETWHIFRSTVSTSLTTTYSIGLESEIHPKFFCWVLVVIDRRDFFRKIQVWTLLLIQYGAQLQKSLGKYSWIFFVSFCPAGKHNFFEHFQVISNRFGKFWKKKIIFSNFFQV